MSANLLTSLLFYFYAAVLVASALGVVLAHNPVRAALCLVLAFFTSAALWLLLEAEFLGIVLVLVYVGAVMVLFLFVVMMLDINVAQLKDGLTRYAWLGGLVAAVMVCEIGYVVWFRQLGLTFAADAPPLPQAYSNTKSLGAVLYTDYLLPFQLAAVLLLVAIVAAIVLTMRRRTGYKRQDIAAQVGVRAADRVRIVRVEAEKRP